MVKHQDNLKTEGAFVSRQSEEWAPGERAPIVKRQDNLKPEGKFEEKVQEEWSPGKHFIGGTVARFKTRVQKY